MAHSTRTRGLYPLADSTQLRLNEFTSDVQEYGIGIMKIALIQGPSKGCVEVVRPCMSTGTQQLGLCGGVGALYAHRDPARTVWRSCGLVCPQGPCKGCVEVVGPCMLTGTQQGLCGGDVALYAHRDPARVVWRW